MAGISPEGEKSRRAVRWISVQLQENPKQKLWPLIEAAITRYDLNPSESEMLLQFYRDNKDRNH